MANNTIYPFGTGGSLPSFIGIINDKYTGGSDKAWSAEQGKEASEAIRTFTERDLSDVSTIAAFITYSTGKWTQSPGSNYKCKLLSVTPGTKYIVKANADRYSYVAVLNTNAHTNNTSVDYATGWTIVRLNAGELYELTVPTDGTTLYVATLNNSNDCTPQFVKVVEEKASALNGEIEEINSVRFDMSSLTATTGWLINGENKWQNVTGASAGDYAYVLVPITAGKKYIFNGTSNSFFAVLDSGTKSSGGTPDFSTGFSIRIFVLARHPFIFTAPEGSAYAYVAVRVSGTDRNNVYVAESVPLAEQLANVDNGSVATKDGFNTAPEYFAWKKAMQMLNFKWTPKKAVPKSTSGNFAADTEQTGTPYSSVAEYDKRLGEDVSFYTFMTALHNPYSLIYTENVRYSTSQSAYGIQYYGASNCAMYYGVVCSGYTSYALGTIPYTTGDFARLAEAGIMEVVYDQSANGVMRGDILWQEGHVLFVQDVWRKNGVVTNVLVTEEWQPLARTRGKYTADTFNAFLASEEIIIYRYKELYKNIHYQQSPFVTVGDETPLPAVTYNDDICTFAGDKAAFAEGDLIYIHCLNLAYPQMEIYKNDVLVETITLASDSRAALTSDELAYAVNLSNEGYTYGKYKCRLKNGDTYSDYTYFEIINAEVTVNGDIATYSSANGKAELWYWQKYHTTDGGKIYNMTELDGQSSGTMDVSNRKNGFPLLKVLFRGEYGRVAARYLES